MDIAIHGEKELLVRLREDLVKAGYGDDKGRNDELIRCDADVNCLIYYHEANELCFHRELWLEDTLYNLTPSNYNEILNIIIERKENGK